MWTDAFRFLADPNVLMWVVIGHAVGLFVGIMPAIGPSFGVALMLPFTFGMDPGTAIVFLVSVHAATCYGDSITSLLVNVPGGVGTVATCWDGYPMSRQGKAATAIGIVTLASWVGGMVSLVCLIVIAELMGRVAFLVGAPEYFGLGILALTTVSVASKDATLKGLIAACFGLIISFIGADPVTGVGYRFTFGIIKLQDGISIVVVSLALFAIVAVIHMWEEGEAVNQVEEVRGSLLAGFREVFRHPVTFLRGALVGLWLGILPAVGTSLAGVSAYLVEKASSKHPETFGHGEPQGLISAESSKGACVVGDLIPTFTLGIPGSSSTGIMMGALIIHGILVGPGFLKQPTLPYVIFVGIFLSQCLYLISGTLLARFWGPILKVPMTFLAPLIVALCFMGTFMDRFEALDLVFLVAIGAFGYILDRFGYPLVCVLLGIILGPLVESNYHRSLAVGFDSPMIFLQRPAAAFMIALAIVIVAWPYVSDFVKNRRVPKASVAASAPVLAEGEGDGPILLGPELVVLASMGVVAAALLVVAFSYSTKVRLFPMMVIPLLLILIVITGIRLYTKARRQPATGPVHRTVAGINWLQSLAGLLGYAILTYLCGFALATGGFVYAMRVLVARKMDQKTGLVDLGVSALLAVGVVLVGIYLRVPFPTGALLDLIRF